MIHFEAINEMEVESGYGDDVHFQITSYETSTSAWLKRKQVLDLVVWLTDWLADTSSAVQDGQ